MLGVPQQKCYLASRITEAQESGQPWSKLTFLRPLNIEVKVFVEPKNLVVVIAAVVSEHFINAAILAVVDAISVIREPVKRQALLLHLGNGPE